MGRRLSKAYLLTKVLTASRQEVVVYLYEGAIGFLHRATEAIGADDREQMGLMLDRAINILIELSGGLNYTGGEKKIAMRLDAIYNYLIETLTHARANADQEAIEACASVLVVLHDAWQQAVQLTRGTEQQPALRLQISA